jgi:hypothetical protein
VGESGFETVVQIDHGRDAHVFGAMHPDFLVFVVVEDVGDAIEVVEDGVFPQDGDVVVDHAEVGDDRGFFGQPIAGAGHGEIEHSDVAGGLNVGELGGGGLAGGGEMGRHGNEGFNLGEGFKGCGHGFVINLTDKSFQSIPFPVPCYIWLSRLSPGRADVKDERHHGKTSSSGPGRGRKKVG